MSGRNSPIAVIAVHGVGNQTPNGMAQSVADLLSARPDRYSSFPTATINIPVRRLRAEEGRLDDPSQRFTNELLKNYRQGSSTIDAVSETVWLEGQRHDDVVS